MMRKNYFTVLLAAALFFVGSSAISAQTAPVRGKVELVKADGTREPVSGAVVEPFRTDAKGKSPSAKTNKKGEFSFAGLQLGQTFALSVSAPNASPVLQTGIKAGMENIVITLSEGDGKRWSEDEVRQSLAAPAASSNTTAGGGETGNQPAELTAEQKKRQAEHEKQVAEISAKNENTKKKTEIVQAALKEGNAAYESKNYDLAITKYSAGVEADPDFVGTTPVLLNNKGAALKSRAIDLYNTQVLKSTDAAAKAASLAKVKQDLQDAVTAYARSYEIMKTAQPADITNQANYEASKLQALTGLTDSHRLLVLTKADTSKSAEAKVAFTDYLAVETDAAKKAKAQITLGDIMREAGDSPNAIEAYRNALAASPDNADAMAGLGLSLFNSGVVTDNKAQMQEGLNYMEKFAQTAPETHPLKPSVKDAVTYLKTEQKLAPQKVTSTKKKN